MSSTLTDGNSGRVILSFVDNEFESVQVLLTVDDGIVTIDIRRVVLLRVAGPLVVPSVRQHRVTDRDGRIRHRVYGQLEYGGTIATFRRMRCVRVRTGSGIGLAVELNGLSFDDVFFNHFVVRMSDGEYQCSDAVASVLRHESVTIDTR